MITYIILEMQTDKAGVTAFVTPAQFSSDADAWAEYYLRLHYAVLSSVPLHTVMLCTSDGRLIQSKSYVHDVNGVSE